VVKVPRRWMVPGGKVGGPDFWVWLAKRKPNVAGTRRCCRKNVSVCGEGLSLDGFLAGWISPGVLLGEEKALDALSSTVAPKPGVHRFP